jgi:hypothetical protein
MLIEIWVGAPDKTDKYLETEIYGNPIIHSGHNMPITISQLVIAKKN